MRMSGMFMISLIIISIGKTWMHIICEAPMFTNSAFGPAPASYYGLSIRKSIDFRIQYEIHDAGVGFDHSFSPSTSLSLGFGILQNRPAIPHCPERPALDPGVTSSIRLKKKFSAWGALGLSASTGWDDGLMEIVPRGFTKFGTVVGSVDYQPVEKINVFANASYRKKTAMQMKKLVFV